MYRIIISYLASALLTLLGWNTKNNHKLQIVRSIPRCVGVYSHTTYWDAFICILYCLAYPEFNVYGLMKPLLFKYEWSARFFSQLGFITSINIQDGGKNTVDRVINIMKDKTQFIFIISPKGTTKRNSWRSGYYHISKGLQCPIRIFALDYAKKDIILGQNVYNFPNSQTNPEKIEEGLKKELAKICPLNKENSEITLDPDIGEGSLFDRKRTVGILLALWVFIWRPSFPYNMIPLTIANIFSHPIGEYVISIEMAIFCFLAFYDQIFATIMLIDLLNDTSTSFFIGLALLSIILKFIGKLIQI